MRLLLGLLMASSAITAAPGWVLIGWNDLGMHCMDGDYSVFSILPPYNTIHAQLVDPAGRLIKSPGGITLTYEAVADASRSINSTSRRKTNFWAYIAELFGANPAIDSGLGADSMPGPQNRPQPMRFDPAQNWFSAEGIPVTIYDDRFNRNAYPMMRLTARDSSGAVLASADIVLPVSDEMDCSACHASGSAGAARPQAGWVEHPVTERDYKLNILRLHDERKGTGLFAKAQAGRPTLCASCHASNALPGTGKAGLAPFTQAMHSAHARVADPVTGSTMDAATNRSACYRCHPGSETRCLRGAMGNAVAADGSMAIQCRDCHGPMNEVGSAQRQGWLEEPTCQSCHPGGGARFTSAFENGQPRVGSNSRFATTPDTPAAGLSLYRFSTGHGGLKCEACHGSTHAELPSSHANDNVQSIAIQGHAGMLSECARCHQQQGTVVNRGPHGLHTLGTAWVRAHGDVAERGTSDCADCHGADLRGSPLSRALAERTIDTGKVGTLTLWRGFQVGCYLCHNGPRDDDANRNARPAVEDLSISTAAGVARTVTLPSSDANGNPLALRIVKQPAGGTVGLAGADATYYPHPGFEGTDLFTFGASDGSASSNLGTVRVTVTAETRPAFGAGAVTNAASFRPGAIAPGEIITIFGSDMGPAQLTTLTLNSAGMVSRSLAGTRVLFDGLPSPVIYTRSNQLSAVAPYWLAGRSSTDIQVEYQGIRSAPVRLEVAQGAPGIFTGGVLNEDGSLNSAAHPAAKGSVVVFWVTGEGLTGDPDVVDGQVTSAPYPEPVLPVKVTIGGIDAPIAFAGAAPGMVAGVMQVNATVPASAPAGGAVPLAVSVAGVRAPPGVTIAVQP
jgi:uncharacterized protein (TIGR03437 family)